MCEEIEGDYDDIDWTLSGSEASLLRPPLLHVTRCFVQLELVSFSLLEVVLI